MRKTWASKHKDCPLRYAPADQLDEVVWNDLCHILMHPTELTNARERAHGQHWLPQQLQQRQTNLRKGRHSLAQQLNRLTDAYLHSIISLPEGERWRRGLEQRDRALAEQKRQLCAQAERHEKLAGLAIGIQDFCKRVQVGLMNTSFEQKRKLVELLMDRVVVTDHSAEIRYVIPTAPRSEHIRFCHLRTDYFAGPKVCLGAALIDAHFVLKPDIDLPEGHIRQPSSLHFLDEFFEFRLFGWIGVRVH